MHVDIGQEDYYTVYIGLNCAAVAVSAYELKIQKIRATV